jgi:hypothetical protein
VVRAGPGLSASVDRALTARGGPHQAGSGYGVAVAACIVALVPWVNSLSWLLFLIWVCLANAGRNRLLRLQEEAPAA